MVYGQSTADEYDLEFLEARCERLANGVMVDVNNNDDFIGVDDSEGETIIRDSFFRDLRKVSRKINKPKSSPKPSKT